MDTTNGTVIDEESALKNLTRRLKGSNYRGIVTCGRGGLSIAQRLAYSLDIEVTIVNKLNLNSLTSDWLFVDDIACTGATIGLIPRNVDVAVLVSRQSAFYKPTFAGVSYPGEEYIKFSWES